MGNTRLHNEILRVLGHCFILLLGMMRVHTALMMVMLVVMELHQMVVVAYPHGPPVLEHPEVCETMMPDHPIDSCGSDCPFEIFATGQCYGARTSHLGMFPPSND